MFSPILNVTKTFQFSPSLGEIVLNSFGRCQIRPTEISQSHMFNARMSANLLLSEWSVQQPNLWEVGLQTIPLIQGTNTYSVPAETVMILDMYISQGTVVTDRYITPISRTEWASYPSKTSQSFPSVYWYDRLISQTVTFWPVPDQNGPYVANYYSVRQTQDADVTNGLNVEIPYRFYEAYSAGLAWKLAEIYAPQLEDKLFARYQRAWQIASTNDIENSPMMITPSLGGYYRS
jgi:hypothetical protein